MRPAFIVATASLLMPSGTRACLNDRDSTLAQEAGRLPDAVRVITGRFPRNPPLFYRMRIQRESAAIERQPDNLGPYDDVAVAWDRLGNDDKALAVMGRKLARMRALKTPGNAANSGDTPWYRYDANTGTFLAHRYIRHPGRYPMSDLKKGRDLVAASIRVNPKAHFGREKVQLAVMDWMLESDGEAHPRPLAYFLLGRMNEGLDAYAAGAATEWREGLEGLIVLGGAWGSPDVFAALAVFLAYPGDRVLSDLASYRGSEIMAQGGRFLVPAAPAILGSAQPGGPPWSVSANFRRLRREADEWQAKRTAYMMERLQAGRHPDTDPTFWADWHEPPAPRIVERPWYANPALLDGALRVTAVFALLTACILAPFFAIRRWRRNGFDFMEFVLLGVSGGIIAFVAASIFLVSFAQTK